MIYQKFRMKSKQQVLQLKSPRLCLQTLMVGLCVLALSIYSVQTATCSASVSSSLATTTERYSFTGSPIVSAFRIVVGPVSNSFYYLYRLFSGSNSAAVRKVDASGSQTWMASFLFNPIVKSLAVDATEQSVYLSVRKTPLIVLKLDASTGALVSQHQL